MGKIAKTRGKKGRMQAYGEQPTGGPAEMTDAELVASGVSDTAVGVLRQLESVESSEREQACETLAHLAENNPRSLSAVLRKGVTLLVSLLSDPTLSVRAAAAGALRNLTFAGVNACELMVSGDLMTPVLAIISRSAQVLRDGQGTASAEDAELQVTLLVQVLATVWNICELSQQACQILTDSEQLALLPSMISVPAGKTLTEGEKELVITTLHLLYVIVDDDSGQVRARLRTPSTLQSLHALANEPAPLISTLAVGVTCDLYDIENELPSVADSLPDVLKVLFRAADFDCVSSLSHVRPALQQVADTQKAEGRAEILVSLTPEFMEWRQHVTAKRIALETLARLAAGMEIDQDAPAAPLYQRVQTMMIEGRVYERALSIVTAVPDTPETASIGADFPDTARYTSQLENHRVVALGALTNCVLASCVPANAPCWAPLTQVLDEATRHKKHALVGAVLHALNVAVKRAGPEAVIGAANLASVPATCTGLLTLARDPVDDDALCHSIELMSQLAPIPWNNGNDAKTQFLMPLGVLLTTSVLGNKPTVISAALNGIFDTFAETDHNDIVSKLRILQNLERAAQNLPTIIRECEEKNEMMQAAELGNDLVNIGGFLEYKAGQ